jgi:hypothetical protein
VGPGGDVVQELKDVIWKVGEQRRLRERRLREEEEGEGDAEVEAGAQANSAVLAANATSMATQETATDDVFTSPSPSLSLLSSPPPPSSYPIWDDGFFSSSLRFAFYAF